TAAVAVLFSLAVARLLTPMLAAYFLETHAPEPDGPLMRWDLDAGRWCVDPAWNTSGLAAAFFFGSVTVASRRAAPFVPADNGTTIIYKIELPPGSTLEETRTVAEAARQAAMTQPEVRHAYLTIGEGASAGGRQAFTVAPQVNAATLMLRLAPLDE